MSFLRVAVNLLDVIGLALIGIAISVLLGTIDSFRALDWFPAVLRTSPPLLLGIVAIIFLSKTVFGILLARKTGLFVAKIEAHHSSEIAKSLFSRGLATTKNLSRADMEWSVLRSSEIAFQRVLNQTMSLQTEASLAIFIFALMLFSDWRATLVISAYFVMILALFQWLASSRFESAGAKLADSSVKVSQIISDLAGSFREIYVTQKIPAFLVSLSEARKKVASSSATYLYLQSIPRLLVETSLVVGALLFLSWEFLRSESGGNFSTLGILLVGSLRIMSALLPLQRSLAELRYISSQADGAQSLLEDAKRRELSPASGPNEEKGKENLDRPAGGIGIELKNVSFNFDDAPELFTFEADERILPVINNVSFTIEPGGYVALVGPSGAGKSTLVDLILGLYAPSSGRIHIGKMPPVDFLSRYPGFVGYVPQKPGIVWGTIAENIALGVASSEVDELAVWDALRAASLEEFVKLMPGGIHSDLGANGDALSGGQRQRLGLARALYTKPQLLVLDEATSALDAETESSITDTLTKLRGDVTMLVVAHRLSTVQHVDKAYVLERGKIIAEGPFSNLREQVPLIRQYIELMSFEDDKRADS